MQLSFLIKKLRAIKAQIESLPLDTLAGVKMDLGALEPTKVKDFTKLKKPSKAKPGFRKDHLGTIVNFLRSKGRRQTMAEIHAGTKIPRASISAVFYVAHPERFQRLDGPHTGKRTSWYLKGEEEKSAHEKAGGE